MIVYELKARYLGDRKHNENLQKDYMDFIRDNGVSCTLKVLGCGQL